METGILNCEIAKLTVRGNEGVDGTIFKDGNENNDIWIVMRKPDYGLIHDNIILEDVSLGKK